MISSRLVRAWNSKAWTNRVKAAYGDIAVYFISLKDLIKNKKLTGRDRDRLEAKYLEKKPIPGLKARALYH